ncbi:MAG: succinyldiaminopimelate transaminase [Nevskiales bacterium]
MNPELGLLQPYPFEKLAQLTAGIVPPADKAAIALSIGEPKHPVPVFILEALQRSLGRIESYPTTAGIPELRGAIAGWLERRFHLPTGSLDAGRHVLPVNGTREALFAFAQAVIDRDRPACVAMPNPFYQIYEGAALLAGAQPCFLPCLEENNFLPDFDALPEATWRECQLLYLCSPGNPTGAVMPMAQLKRAIELAERHGFVIASDECYSEIYLDEATPPPGLLQAAVELGLKDFRRCVVFHSLSKRSNVPGLRSGFVAGDPEVLRRFLLYRTYHGCAMNPAVQQASVVAWQDETHVVENRAQYRAKFDAVLRILGDSLPTARPAASFYLWPRTPIDDRDFTRELLARENLRVVPGRYLSREVDGRDPGANRIRISLVPPLAQCEEAARRLRDFVSTLG